MTAVGSGTRQQTSAKGNRSHKLLLFGLPIARVSFLLADFNQDLANSHVSDANAFKEAFIKAQQENEALFKQD